MFFQQPEVHQSIAAEPEETSNYSPVNYAQSTSTAPNGSTYINYQDEDECIDDAFESTDVTHGARLGSESTGYASARNYPVRCVALYSFQVNGSLIFLIACCIRGTMFQFFYRGNLFARHWWISRKEN